MRHLEFARKSKEEKQQRKEQHLESVKQIQERIKKFERNEKVNSYILDLRNNPGGLLSQAIRISDLFLDNGEIVSTKSRKKSENRKWFAKKRRCYRRKNIIGVD